jgi:endonuclease G, mitochondrial
MTKGKAIFTCILSATIFVYAANDAQHAKVSKRHVSTTVSTNQSPLLADTHKSGVKEKMLKREGYTVSYNSDTRQPNYVAWELTAKKLEGKNKRKGTFFEDPELYDNEKARLKDYYNSGYDRGHICPAADNKWSKIAMIESFYLSNICPQTHTLNAGDWLTLEEKCRKWAKKEDLHIISGPIFRNQKRTKLRKRVDIPTHFFKAIVTLEKGKEKGIAFIYSNDQGHHPIDYYVCSIDDVEAITKFDLFSSLPTKLQTKIEAQKNLKNWK